MPYSNPVLGGDVLIRDAMQSENYEAGADGWQVTRLGDAEFNDAVIRGSVVIGTDMTGRITLSGVLTPELFAAYTAGGDTLSNAWIRLDPGSGITTYFYEVVGVDAAGNNPFWARGLVEFQSDAPNPTVHQGLYDSWLPVSGFRQMDFGGADATTDERALMLFNYAFFFGQVEIDGSTQFNDDAALLAGSGASFHVPTGTSLDIDQGGAFTIDGNTAPRGTIAANQMQGNPVTGGAISAETVVAVLPSATYQAGRVYRVLFHGPINQSVATVTSTFRIRRGNTVAGSQSLLWVVDDGVTARNDIALVAYAMGPVGGYTGQLCLTVAATGGTISLTATGAGQGQVVVDDVGDTSVWMVGTGSLPSI